MSEAKPYDPSSEGAEMAFAGRMSYGDYLQIDAILGAQKPLSSAPTTRCCSSSSTRPRSSGCGWRSTS